MKFGSKRAIFGVIWGGFEGFGPCLGVSHPTHPHLGEISPKKRFFWMPSLLWFIDDDLIDEISADTKSSVVSLLMPLTQVGAAGETEQLVREDQVENEIKLFTLVLHSCLVLIHVILVVETLMDIVHYAPLW